jgi:hypothetical protein
MSTNPAAFNDHAGEGLDEADIAALVADHPYVAQVVADRTAGQGNQQRLIEEPGGYDCAQNAGNMVLDANETASINATARINMKTMESRNTPCTRRVKRA